MCEDDKVKFALCKFEVVLLTWWNGNVQTLGLVSLIRSLDNVKAMMTSDTAQSTEIHKDGTRALKKIEKYVRGFPERIKGNITSSKPCDLCMRQSNGREWSSNQIRLGAA
ncbi:hypothetical protein Tco_1201416 [Tanacetum coccineum]